MAIKDESIVRLAATVSQLLRCRRSPCVVASSEITGPIVVGVFRPIIILPFRNYRRLNERELKAVLLHEGAHVVMWDQLLLLTQQVANVLFWPNPLVHLVNRCLTRAREEVCDNHVLGVLSRKEYCCALLRVATMQWHCGTAFRGVALGTADWSLESRIRGILDARRRTMARCRLGILALVALSIGLIGVATPAIETNQGDAARLSNAELFTRVCRADEVEKERAFVAPAGRELIVQYLEFDLLHDEELFATICHELAKRRTERHDEESVQKLKSGAKLLKELRTVVPIKAGRVSEGRNSLGESMLRVRITSVSTKGRAYSIKADLERWDVRNGQLEFTCAIRQQDFEVQPGTWYVATVNAPRVVNATTNKTEVRKLVLWTVQVLTDELAQESIGDRDLSL